MPRIIEPIRIPPPVVRILPPPPTRDLPRPSLAPPVLEVPNPIIEYPTLDVPTQEDFRGQMQQPQEQKPEEPVDTRDLPPTVTLPGVGDVELPPVAPILTAGATAIVVTTVTIGSTILLNALKDKFLGPLLDRMSKPKKVKIKQKKPVLHFVQAEDGAQLFEYSVKGTRLVATTDNIEQYLRDQVDIDSLYEFDNKIIVDDSLQDKFTKEGAKRFKKHFTPAKTVLKKLSAKFSL